MKYTIKSGDTLQMIAQTQLGDALLWMDIAQLNNLKYPYISSTPADGVVTPGDDIDLPLSDYTIGEEQPSFGTDLYLSTDQFTLTSGAGGDFSVGLDGDYELAVEIDSLIQDKTHRMMTPRGSRPYNPEYGSDLTNLVGAKKGANWKVKAELEISRTVKSDPRITDITDITVSDLSTGISIDYKASAQGIVFRPGGVE
jgi:phage baseplate assembly protein W